MLKKHWRWLGGALLVGAIALAVLLSLRAASHARQRAFRLQVPVAADSAAFDNALYQSLGLHLRGGHTVERVRNGAVFDALVAQVSAARRSINLLMYIWEKGAASERVVSALVARAKQGVRCRIIVDDLGSPDFARDVQPALAAAGCEVRIFRPLPAGSTLGRNHRKLLVVDGRWALTGGFGIRDNWLGNGDRDDSWRDTSVSFTGPSVAEAQQAFAENWQEAGGALLPADDFLTQETAGPASATFVSSTGGELTRAERLLQLTIASATRRIWIANAYFVPSRGIIELLEQKARAGLDVRLLAPAENSDSKTAFGAQHLEYGSLIEQGLRVWEYTAAMMHAKTMVIDDELSLVGSINLDPLSLNTLEEVALLVRDPTLNQQLAADFEADCRRSKPVR